MLLQSSVLLLLLSEIACTLEVSGEDQVVAVEVLNMSPVQMGNIRVSDLLAGLLQGKKKKQQDFWSVYQWVANLVLFTLRQCSKSEESVIKQKI